MTRVEPRALVSAPRPSSAWLMVLVASATLWITGEIDVWVMPVQLACYGVSYWTRRRPPAWRQSAVWLNVGMFGITSVTIAKALQGNPATLSLAYFAALSQGLLLIDARPRKSEFLLVALALFQVILASNLTDSVFFPPLLLVFLVTVTWTLMVHTLRAEAAEAGDAAAASRAITPGLMRTTLVASGLSLLLAIVLFAVLPRMRSQILRGGVGPGMAVAGFNDEVSLGTLGRIRRDDTVVLRVETLTGAPPDAAAGYWRGLAFDAFDGRSWSITPPPGRAGRKPLNGVPRFGVVIGGGPSEDAVVQRIVREPVEAGVLFSPGPLRRIEGPMQRLELDTNGGVYFPARSDERVRYTLWAEVSDPTDEVLSGDRAAPPVEHGPHAAQRRARWLALPDLDPRIPALAAEITAGLESDADRLRALEHWLRRQGRYTDEPPEMGSDGERSPVEDFLLGELAGHCEYFASGMVVLARSLGLPTRLVNGFAGGRINTIGGFTELVRSDAHAWVEAHFAEAGWVRYDPTPPSLRLRAAGELSLAEQIAELASVIELWWFQRVVDFDSSDQVLALKEVWLFFRELGGHGAQPAAGERSTPGRERGRRGAPGAPLPWSWLTALAAIAAGAGGLFLLRQRDRAERRVPRYYERALALLARRDLQRAPATTARRFADEVAEALPAEVAACFTRITEDYLAARFGGESERRAAAERHGDLAALSDHLRRSRHWRSADRPPAP